VSNGLCVLGPTIIVMLQALVVGTVGEKRGEGDTRRKDTMQNAVVAHDGGGRTHRWCHFL
jgi:hypothetical protein